MRPLSLPNHAANAILKVHHQFHSHAASSSAASTQSIFGRQYKIEQLNDGNFRVKRIMPKSLFKRMQIALADRCSRKQDGILTSRAKYYESMLNKVPQYKYSEDKLLNSLTDEHTPFFLAIRELSPQRLDALVTQVSDDPRLLKALIADAPLSLGKMLYVSEENGVIDSIHFEQGSINFGQDGVKARFREGLSVERFTLDDSDMAAYEKWRRDHQPDISEQVAYLTKCSSKRAADIGSGRLVEVWQTEEGDVLLDISKGCIKKSELELDQIDINILCNVSGLAGLSGDSAFLTKALRFVGLNEVAPAPGPSVREANELDVGLQNLFESLYK